MEFTWQAKAWTDTAVMKEWLQRVLVPWRDKYHPGRRVLLLLDGKKPHCTEEFLALAKDASLHCIRMSCPGFDLLFGVLRGIS